MLLVQSLFEEADAEVVDDVGEDEVEHFLRFVVALDLAHQGLFVVGRNNMLTGEGRSMRTARIVDRMAFMMVPPCSVYEFFDCFFCTGMGCTRSHA